MIAIDQFCLKLWKAPSYLTAVESELFNIPPQIFINAMTAFFNLDLDIDCILTAFGCYNFLM